MVIAIIDSTIREKSRTRDILEGIIGAFNNVEFKYYNLNSFDIDVTNARSFPKKSMNVFFYNVAKEIANADGIIVAAPFWDMTYPALLKAFIEKISILDVMFADGPTECIGLSKNHFMLYITTRGMNIKTNSPLDGGSKSLKCLCKLWGIPSFTCVSAYNLDYLLDDEIKRKIQKAINVGIKKLRYYINGKD